MTDFDSIEDLVVGLRTNLDATPTKKRIIALYAFNATGKTRLSNLLSGKTEDWEEKESNIEVDNEKIKTLCYNAFLEDMFTWNNEKFILKFDPNSRIMKLIDDEGLESAIINNFKDIVNSNDLKIEPFFDFKNWIVSFKIASGDDASRNNIKISKGEESVFVWSVFYTVLETAISELILVKENRSIHTFDDLEYIIIDDPVSSIDDTRIITLAVKLVYLIKNDHIFESLRKTKEELEKQEFTTAYIEERLKELRSENYSELKIRFLLTTHHALYYNVLVNSFRQEQRNKSFKSFSLSKYNNIFRLTKQWDSPFSYHLAVKKLIQKAIIDDVLEKYHFNLFRALLEKTANFLGHENWYDCIIWDKKQESTRLLNLYSHNKLSDLESNELSTNDKILFQETFNTFMQTFNWN